MQGRSKAFLPALTIAAVLVVGLVGAFGMDLDPPAARAATDVVTGSIIHMDTGTPPLRSDRLAIQLGSVQSPPAGYTVQCYLVEGAAGLSCGELTISGGAIDATRDYAGNNLIQNYSNFRLMWEQQVFVDTLPPAALDLIRLVLYQAANTPNSVGYGVGMVKEAGVLRDHANLARLAAQAGQLAGAKTHAEHVLNILYGAADSRYGDYNGDGKKENPGDGFGLLAYAANVQLNMLDAAESDGVTPYIADQAFAVSTVVGNFAPADGSGTWSDDLVIQAHGILSATTAGEAQPFAVEMNTIAQRIRNGVDDDGDGTVEAIADEGGALVAFATAQRTADYFPPTAGAITGTIQHQPSGSDATSDKLAISLANVPQPPGGFGLWGYLQGPDGARQILGELPWSSGTVAIELSYPGSNLIGEFNSFYLAYGSLYAQDTAPAAVLPAIRSAMGSAADTPGKTAYAVGLVEQAEILKTAVDQASAAAAGNNLAEAKTRANEALKVLFGQADVRYPGGGTDPGDGYGVLGYAGKLDQTMQTIGNSASATANMAQHSAEARSALANFYPASGTDTWSDQLIAQLQLVLDATSAGEAAGPASQATVLADQILNGSSGAAGSAGPATTLADQALDDSGGARAAYLAAQQTADYYPQEAGATGPEPNPEAGPNPDTYENDDVCTRAEVIAGDGTTQSHTFHYEGDQDWVRFTAQANKSYEIEVIGTGSLADPVIFLHDTCTAPPASFTSNAFGNTVRLLWNATKNGVYYIQLSQFDPAQFGENTEYDLTVTLDVEPPSAPTNLRCLAIDQTTVALQWTRSPEPDVVGYRVNFRNEAATDTGNRDVDGASTTFVELDGLTPNELYQLNAIALDYSNNESTASGDLPCRPAEPADKTTPVINSLAPSFGTAYTTTSPALTFSGDVQDSFGNLSRVVVKNASTNQEKTDFSLSGGTAEFRVEDLPMRAGTNDIRISVFDEANNVTERQLAVERLTQSGGAVIIVAGHNETFGLQTNIYNATNRAYRVFQSAGFAADDIYYLAPVAQDATGDGTADTRDVTLSPAAVETAITEWAKPRLDEDKVLYLYMMDHGFADKYCVTGCSAGNVVTPKDLNQWLRETEDETGVGEVNIIMEACQSGSFLDNLEGDATNVDNSLARQGRVVITSTSRENNAYASAEGAYFSDAFFSCIAESSDLKSCFDEGVSAVVLAGVSQTPWLDDNGDGLFSGGDGSVASTRKLTRFFSSVRPRIRSSEVTVNGTSGVLEAEVQAGAEAVKLVWAAVYPPSFQEPDGVTLNLNVPVVRLEPVSGAADQYRVDYANGFTEEGEYRVVFYAQDRVGISAVPKRAGDTFGIHLPVLSK